MGAVQGVSGPGTRGGGGPDPGSDDFRSAPWSATTPPAPPGVDGARRRGGGGPLPERRPGATQRPTGRSSFRLISAGKPPWLPPPAASATPPGSDAGP